MDVAYVDSSAIVKFIVREPQSSALRRFLRRFPVHASSGLARAEVIRAIGRADRAAIARAQAALQRLLLVELTGPLLEAAGVLEPPSIRTLDAIHLATAKVFGGRLGTMITYDERMADAAERLGLPVDSPA